MKLTIRAKILGVSATLLVALAITAGMGIWALKSNNQRLGELSRSATTSRLAAQTRAALAKVGRAERDFLLASSEQGRTAALAVVDAFFQERDDRRRELRDSADPALAGRLDELDAALREYDEVHKQVRALKQKASNEHATAMLRNEAHKQSEQLEGNLRALDSELARRPVTAELVAARAQLWQALYEVPQVDDLERTIILEVDDAAMDAALKRAVEHTSALGRLIAGLGRIAVAPDERRLASTLAANYTAFEDVHGKARTLARDNGDGAAVILLQTKGRALVDKAAKASEDVLGTAIASAAAAEKASEAAYGTSRTTLLVTFLLALALGLTLALVIARYISKALAAAADLARAVASGDLTRTAAITHHDEIGAMMTALNEMVENLRSVAHEVTTASTAVSTGAEQLSATAGQLAEGASQQGAATEQTTAAMEQMGASVQQNSDNAQQTDRLASKASADAQASGHAVVETVSAMKNIAEKIGIIEEIARKTDLLALNAAVEAARAGEHGKGFAVVASEVRKLAERSSIAAAEISQLSRSGVVLAEGAGTMLTRLVPDIRKTAELVQEVSAASREQNTGIEQSNKALQDLDRVTQQNAAAAEQMAATAGELSSQAQQLQTAIEFFKLDGAGHRQAQRAPRPPQTRSAPPPRTSTALTRPRPGRAPRAATDLPRSGDRATQAQLGNGRSGASPRGIELDLGAAPTNDDALFERY
jgi:methyl-accepting chemotaxis protein